MASLAVPEQWTLCKMNTFEVAEEIERLVQYVNDEGRSSNLPKEFVNHYVTRHDSPLPIVVAIATLPIVLADGGILGMERGLDVERGTSFIIPREVMALVPEGEVTAETVAKEMKFLTDEWLVDVAADYAGKCTIIAAALSIIERSLLDSRPTFFITAGRRGSGKTTTLIMLIKAVTGIWPAAAAWSSNEEERRKAIMSYFLAGVPYILWDNIARGTQISCPHIERSCTSAYYADRRLGVSEMVRAAAGAVHLFTGNAIGPKGDMASRSLTIQLDADRPDPENRTFKHNDPVAWTDANRVEILRAFYTILLGNPTLKKPRNAPMKTRFKIWWRLVGSAVEHAAAVATAGEEKVDFAKLFRGQDVDDEDDASLVDTLNVFRTWVEESKCERNREDDDNKFTATELMVPINTIGYGVTINPVRDAYREHFFPGLEPGQRVSSGSIGKRLKYRVNEPVRGDGEILTLKCRKSSGEGHAPAIFWIESKPGDVVPAAMPVRPT